MVAPTQMLDRIAEVDSDDFIVICKREFGVQMPECYVTELAFHHFKNPANGAKKIKLIGKACPKMNLAWVKGFSVDFDPTQMWDMKRIESMVHEMTQNIRKAFVTGEKQKSA
jgi:hypothetical protein